MDEKSESFPYIYSAKQQEEIQNIRKKYTATEEDKMEQLRRPDHRRYFEHRLQNVIDRSLYRC